MAAIVDKQLQQRVAVGPKNAQFMSIRQSSLRRDAAAAVAALICCRCKAMY